MFCFCTTLGSFVTLGNTGITIGECMSLWTYGTCVGGVAARFNIYAIWIYALVLGDPYVSERIVFLGHAKCQLNLLQPAAGNHLSI